MRDRLTARPSAHPARPLSRSLAGALAGLLLLAGCADPDPGANADRTGDAAAPSGSTADDAASTSGDPVRAGDCPVLPSGFSYLNTIDPSIDVDLRYASTDNFTGEVVDGYGDANAVVLRTDAATALAGVQTTLADAGLGLLVYDGFRPTRAVDSFMAWSRTDDDRTRDEYYPEFSKSELFELGYIAEQSGHSLGGTVDLTLVELDSGEPLDMGSPFDLFDERSHYAAEGIGDDAFVNRTLLREAMIAAGFEPYPQEWWHFSYPVPEGAERLDFALEPCG